VDVMLVGETGSAVSPGYGGPEIAADSTIARIRLRNAY
jgi:hypothetical protein